MLNLKKLGRLSISKQDGLSGKMRLLIVNENIQWGTSDPGSSTSSYNFDVDLYMDATDPSSS